MANLSSLGGMTIGTLALSTIVSAILTFLVCLIVINILMKLVDRSLDKSKKLDGTLKGFVRSAANIILWVIAAIIIWMSASSSLPSTLRYCLTSASVIA